jgi:hypothetical protein
MEPGRTATPAVPQSEGLVEKQISKYPNVISAS